MGRARSLERQTRWGSCRKRWFAVAVARCLSLARGLLVLALFALASMPRAALAQESEAAPSSEALVLDYQAPSQCPGREAFEAQVGALTRAATFDASVQDPSARVLVIRVAPGPAQVTGELRLSDGDTEATRRFEAATCEEVVEALALATALALDPEALGGEPSTPDEPSGNTTPVEPVVLEENAGSEEEVVKPPQPVERFHVNLGLRGQIGSYRARMRVSESDPTLQLESYVRAGGSAFVEFEVRPFGFWSSVDAEVGLAAGKVDVVALFWEPIARVGLCPGWWEVVGSFRLAPCARLSLGAVRASMTTDDYGGARRQFRRETYSVFSSLRGQFLLGNFRMSVEVGADTPIAENQYDLAVGATGRETLLRLTRHVAPHAVIGLGWEVF